MKPTLRPKVKICCIQNVAEARMAVDNGASAIGLVSEMPSGPGPIPEERIAEIAATIPVGVSTFLLTSKQDAPSIIRQQKRTGANTLQIVDVVPFDTYRQLRDSIPGIVLVQVIHVQGEESVDEALAVSGHVDAVLLDSGNPKAPVKLLGGTGRVHDWSISRKIREAIPVPLFLAGGLRGENVRQAIEQVQPYALDVCSGVRTNGLLDPLKLKAFFEAALMSA